MPVVWARAAPLVNARRRVIKYFMKYLSFVKNTVVLVNLTHYRRFRTNSHKPTRGNKLYSVKTERPSRGTPYLDRHYHDADWQKLRAELDARHIRVVAMDLPTSWMMAAKASDEFTGRMFEAINRMLLDMLAAVARKDYEDRRRRQMQGQARAKAEGRYKGRAEDSGRNAGIAVMLGTGQSWSSIQATTGCSRGTIAKIAKRVRPIASGLSHITSE